MKTTIKQLRLLIREALGDEALNDEVDMAAIKQARDRRGRISVFRALANHEDSRVREQLAGNLGVASSILAKLATDEDEEVRAAAAGNEHTPAKALEQLLSANESEVSQGYHNIITQALASNRGAPMSLLKRIVELDPTSYLLPLLRNPSIDSELVRSISNADDKDPQGQHGGRMMLKTYREEMLLNPSTPPHVLRKFSKHRDPDYRADVAENPSTPPNTLTMLSQDKNASVRRMAKATMRKIHAGPHADPYGDL